MYMEQKQKEMVSFSTEERKEWNTNKKDSFKEKKSD